MIRQIAIQSTAYGNTTIDHGVLSGVDWYKYGDTPNIPPTCQQIVEFIKDNMIELAREGFLDDERLADNAGFLVSWILGEYVS